MAIAQEQRISYLTYPDTFQKRRHHSDLLAGRLTPFRRQPHRETGALSCYKLVETQCSTDLC